MKKNLLAVCRRILLFLFLSLQVTFLYAGKNKGREYYQLTVYHFKTAAQEQTLNNYLKNALLPALHRMGTDKAGVFKALANDTAADKLIYVFVTMKSLDAVIKLPAKLNADTAYLSAGADYINTAYQQPAYTRMENIVLLAFPLAPAMQVLN